MSVADPAGGPWHLDRRIPLALILAIIAQTGGGFWWASSVTERLHMLERTQAETKGFAADLAVIKSQISDIRQSQQRLENRLDGRPEGGKLNFYSRGGETYTVRPAERAE